MRFKIGGVAVALVVSASCSQSKNPAAPPTSNVEQPADGVTLKIDPPILSQPSNGAKIDFGTGLALRLKNVEGTFETFPVTYEFEIHRSTGELIFATKLPANPSGTTSFIAPDTLDASLPGGVPLTWRARATSNDLVGPWSKTSTFTALQAVNVPGSSQFDVATPVQLNADLLQLSTRTDCTPRAKWSVDNPSVASVSDQGLLTLRKFGQTNLNATCDGVVSLPKSITITEIWYGNFVFTNCVKLLGSVNTCFFDVGKSYNIRLLIQDTDGFHVSGSLVDLTGHNLNFSGTISADGQLAMDASVFYADCGADNGPRSTTIEGHVVNGSVGIHVVESNWFDGGTPRGGCLAGSPPTREWQISGTVGNLHR